MIRVDLLGPSGEVRSSVIRPSPVVVGSGPECPVRIMDPSVADRHVELSRGQDETVVVRDLGSAGGTRVQALVVTEAMVPNGTEVRLGSVILRVGLAGTAAAPSTGDLETGARSGPGRPLWERLTRPTPGVAWGLFLAVGGIIVLQEYSTAYVTDVGREVATMGLGLVLLGVGWAGAWSLGNRIFGHPFSFARHLGIMSLWLLLFTPVWWFSEALHQVAHLGSTRLFEQAVGVASGALLLFLHIQVASRWRPRVNAAITGGVLALVAGLILIADEDTTRGPIEAALTPVVALPGWLYLTRPADELPARAEELTERLSDMEAPRGASRSFPPP